jgi:hypothetical protein
VVNRAVLLLRCKEPASRWINDADPYPSSELVTLADVNSERTAYLISQRAADTPQSLARWLRKNYAALFESELYGWYTDPTLWPAQRSYKLFKAWFVPECHTIVLDVEDYGIYDDET